MLTTVAIFGDSHGDCSYLPWNRYSIGPGWPEYLKQMAEYSVTNYCQGGTGSYYSYKNFLNHHEQFDKIIFIPSQAGRFTINVRDEQIHIVPGHVHSIVPQLDRFSKDSIEYKTIKAAIDYCYYVIDFDKEGHINDLFLDSVLKIRPDAIIIPAFKNIKWPDDCLPLAELSIREEQAWNLDRKELRKGPPLWDIRKCHITEEHNKLLWSKIVKAIKTNQTFVYLTEKEMLKSGRPYTDYFINTPDGLPGNV